MTVFINICFTMYWKPFSGSNKLFLTKIKFDQIIKINLSLLTFSEMWLSV